MVMIMIETLVDCQANPGRALAAAQTRVRGAQRHENVGPVYCLRLQMRASAASALLWKITHCHSRLQSLPPAGGTCCSRH